MGRPDTTLSVFAVLDFTYKVDDRRLPQDGNTRVPFTEGTISDRDILLFYKVLWKKLLVKSFTYLWRDKTNI